MSLRLATLISTSLVLTPASGWATPISIGESQTWTYDGTSAGCSACLADVTFELLSATSVKISFENTSTDLVSGVNVLTGIGFDTAGELTDISILSQEIEGGKVWKLGEGIGEGNWEIGLKSANGINNGLDNQSNSFDGGWVILRWSSPPLSSGLMIESSVVKFQATENGGTVPAPGVPGGGEGEGEGQEGEGQEGAGVPEPSSLALLLTAFALGARRYARRVS